MPGKINPSILEMGNQVMYKVLGNDSALAYAIQAGQLELNVMMPLMAHLMLESSHLLINTIFTIREKCIAGITANRDICLKHAYQSSQIATALNPLLGHNLVAELVKEAVASDLNIIELIMRKKLLSNEKIEELLDIEKLTGI